ncbi:flagellar basal body-associated protein FliL [Pseudomonas sp. CBSPBW29]|jgi:flagellar FliL protein|uniref:flagellar basal body-associated protein FliL n=1 Tax=Pseudomonas TaxID=286 RepID=UPI0021ACB989|nr:MULTISPECIES: flagellar basal body-associated protein FliL [unclassified Pseudomonas]WEL42134.1 flagellar basal body-associated protein FliL [Pseudomonas sp. CBSPBW29]WEL63196.1 flagellar basal body-associated protein FliL [Pseudomonas sp. CBSPGW29]WEL72380.1 flagellar basal body-associated protein FliL [Pseudomonas sp. CBSPCGW29]WEL79280.1 flagellar basal body-associated protein FliL [Pseudomonas sp. CBSPAW29]WEL90542.1 flagellar basal body-associated protein FliL [Pseudomonas sp. CBSPCBW2
MAKSDDVATPPAGKGKLKLILVIVLALFLAIGLSVGATWYFMHSAQSKPAATAEVNPNVKQPAIFEPMLPAFVANFNQNGRQRYLQVSITLLARNQADLDALKVHMPVIRNNLVMLFSAQPFDTLATPVGQEMLRQKVTASVQEVAQKEVGKPVIEQVLFTNFVLQ